MISVKLASPISPDRPRRRPSGHSIPTPPLEDISFEHFRGHNRSLSGASSGVPSRAFAQPLGAIPATPAVTPPMSLSRSPSPRPNGGWASRGLTDSGSSSPYRTDKVNGFAGQDSQWAAARARSEAIRERQRLVPSIQTKNEGFFQRSKRKISATLPLFDVYQGKDKDWRESEKLGRGRWYPRGGGRWGTTKTFIGNVLRRFKFFFMLLAAGIVVVIIMSNMNLKQRYRRNSHLGGGSKYVIILATNEGGGVMDWKGPREWAIERDSIRNKKRYAERWGYGLELADMSTKKRYAHEWRESWEKVDIIRNTMAKFPQAEWFWWLDLNTFIMEPSISLQQHIFNDLSANTYRDINNFNPLNITHPPTSDFLDEISRSPTGDNKPSSIDLIIPQDCSGFNLGSFFVRRSSFIDQLLDIWWDPVLYEQKHMEWEHKEQDALEHIYTAQPYMRTHIAFIEQRKVNSFPPAACRVNDEDGDAVVHPRYHYDEGKRDFLVNMAGCEWGRDCWGEMYSYRELSNKLNRTRWEKFKDGVNDYFQNLKKEWFEGGPQKSQESEASSES